MPYLLEIARGLAEAASAIRAIVVHLQKISPNHQDLAEQLEEFVEVLEFLIERVSCREVQELFKDEEGARVSLATLLTAVSRLSAWIVEHDADLRSLWSAQQSSDGIEGQRARILRSYAIAISLSFLERCHESEDIKDSLAGFVQHVEATQGIDQARLSRVANFASPVTHHKVKDHIKKEREELLDGIADFEGSDADGYLTQVTEVLTAVAQSKLQEQERAQSLASLVAERFTFNDRATSLFRRASASTWDSPLEPHLHRHLPTAPSRPPPAPPVPSGPLTARSTLSSDMYTDFRPSFVPSVSGHIAEYEGGSSGTSAASTSQTRRPGQAMPSSPSTSRTSDGVDSSRGHSSSSQTAPGSARRRSSEPARSSHRDSGPSSLGNQTRSSGISSNTSTSAHTTSIIAFNARDALTDTYLIDPVLGSDGLIHDRWCLIEADPANHEVTKHISILGEVIQLREAIHAAHTSRREEYYKRRAAYRKTAVEMCTTTDRTVMEECLVRLTNILQWKADDVEILTRRGVLHYRLRHLSEAKADLDAAVKTSTTSSLVNLPNLDSLRYRSLVLAEIRDSESAMQDIEGVMRQTSDDPLALSLRATMSAGRGDSESALADLEMVQKALESGGGSQSMLADENRDLDLLAKGWAHSSLGDIETAVKDFEMAQSLRLFDAYSVACLGISLVHWGLTLQAKGSAELGQEKVEQGIRELTSAVVVVSRHTTTGDELTMPSPDGTVYDELAAMTLSSQAYDPFFLRGMANFALHNYEEALEDFDVARRVRPKIVKDTGEFHCVLAILQAETGQYDAAVRNFDYAMALKPEERGEYLARRAHYGL